MNAKVKKRLGLRPRPHWGSFEGLTSEVEKLAYRFHDGTPLSTLSYLDRVFITDRNYCYFRIVFDFGDAEPAYFFCQY